MELNLKKSEYGKVLEEITLDQRHAIMERELALTAENVMLKKRNDELKQIGAEIKCDRCGEWLELKHASIYKNGDIELCCRKCEQTYIFVKKKKTCASAVENISHANGPITEFKSEEQAYECLREWQEMLFLQDWIIKLELCDEIKEKGCELAGQCQRINDNKTTIIRILKKNPYPDHYTKFCAEKTMVHELCHLKLDMCSHTKHASIESVVYDGIQHQIVEQMAKSLIMAKYGVDFSWFKNF